MMIINCCVIKKSVFFFSFCYIVIKFHLSKKIIFYRVKNTFVSPYFHDDLISRRSRFTLVFHSEKTRIDDERIAISDTFRLN